MAKKSAAPRDASDAAIRNVCKRFNLRLTGPQRAVLEDWEIDAAAPARVEELCDAYEHSTEDADERFALMQVILSSYNDRLADGGEPTLDPRLEKILIADFNHLRNLVRDWAAMCKDPDDPLFQLGPLMRSVLAVAAPKKK
jgi:hypothetical protein